MRTSSLEEMHKAANRELTDLRRRKAELESESHKKDQDIHQAHSHGEALDKVNELTFNPLKIILLLAS